MSIWLGIRVPRHLVKHYFGVSVRVLPGDIGIWIGRLSKAQCPPWCGWIPSNQLKAWMEQKGWPVSQKRELLLLGRCSWDIGFSSDCPLLLTFGLPHCLLLASRFFHHLGNPFPALHFLCFRSWVVRVSLTGWWLMELGTASAKSSLSREDWAPPPWSGSGRWECLGQGLSVLAAH